MPIHATHTPTQGPTFSDDAPLCSSTFSYYLITLRGDHFIFPLCNVARQLNTFALVGTAMIIVVDVKYARVSTSVPRVDK